MKDLQNNRPQTRSQTKSESCGICFNPVELQVLNYVKIFKGQLDCCSHIYCHDCIEKWSQIENTCPLCKQKFSSIQQKWKRVTYIRKKIKKQKIIIEDKSQSDPHDYIWWELLIQFLLSDTIQNLI
ncbi:hypothetical protein pb186bvf_014853 [Paramecium bursaria]